ncbi:CsgG/HfaB family protein [Megamonas hypermegale]|uniref:CsgG/HfaB family protein n=2 Tax=Megamonas hypermegale TaxID=158847 RepID=UPI0026ECCB43|nr:CsgG/HfaB family protein [Megamonas hypermegale]
MKQFICSLLFIFMFIFPIVGETAVKKVAVGNFINAVHTEYGDMACNNLQSAVLSGLVQHKNYIVLDRSDLEEMLQKMGIQDLTKIEGDKAIQLGNISGADYTLIGTVISAEVIPFDNVAYIGLKAKVVCELHLVDNKTGIVLNSNVVSGTDSSIVYNRLNDLTNTNILPEYFSTNANNLICNAAIDAADKIMVEMNKVNPLSGEILSVDMISEKVYFNLGYENGVQLNDIYTVYEEGAPLIQPQTGEFIGVKEKLLGTIEIVEVSKNYSVGKIKKQKGDFKRGNKVKRGNLL